MSFLKMIPGVSVIFLTLAIMVMSQPAIAAPTTLVCSNDTRPDLAQVTVVLEEAKDTAVLNYDASGQMPASTKGPFTATYSPQTVTFDDNNEHPDNGQWAYYNHYTIDRMTLIFLNYSSMKAPWDQAAPEDKALWHYTCHLGKVQF